LVVSDVVDAIEQAKAHIEMFGSFKGALEAVLAPRVGLISQPDIMLVRSDEALQIREAGIELEARLLDVVEHLLGRFEIMEAGRAIEDRQVSFLFQDLLVKHKSELAVVTQYNLQALTVAVNSFDAVNSLRNEQAQTQRFVVQGFRWLGLGLGLILLLVLVRPMVSLPILGSQRQVVVNHSARVPKPVPRKVVPRVPKPMRR
jgi:hypothetical protein